MGRLDTKTAVITGATSGIGREIAIQFAEEGATVGINHLPDEKDRADDVVQLIQEAGGEAKALEADVSDEDAVQIMSDVIEEKFDSLDILVNNAGIQTMSPLEEMSSEIWDDVLDVNLRGTFLVTRELLPQIRSDDGGTIINITSQLGFKGKENMVHYCASKGGLITFTRALAREVAPEITVNGIAPGPIDTGISEVKDGGETIPIGRRGDVSDVAPTAVFLASDESEFYTGQILSPDGGDAMH